MKPCSIPSATCYAGEGRVGQITPNRTIKERNNLEKAGVYSFVRLRDIGSVQTYLMMPR